jgi:hypothetical protein
MVTTTASRCPPHTVGLDKDENWKRGSTDLALSTGLPASSRNEFPERYRGSRSSARCAPFRTRSCAALIEGETLDGFAKRGSLFRSIKSRLSLPSTARSNAAVKDLLDENLDHRSRRHPGEHEAYNLAARRIAIKTLSSVDLPNYPIGVRASVARLVTKHPEWEQTFERTENDSP